MELPDLTAGGNGTTVVITLSGVFMLTVAVLLLFWRGRNPPPQR